MKILSSNAVAKSMPPRKVPGMRPLALFLALAITASAQQPEPQPQPQPQPQPPAQPQPPPAPEGGRVPPPRPSGPGPGQGMQPPGPPPHRDHDRSRSHDGDRRGPPGMMPGMGGKPSMRYDGFEKLSEEEKSKVRAAFEKAWQRPEVIEARDKAMRANEEMRSTLHAALKDIDPQVVVILEKIKPPFPMDQRGLPEMPKPESPEFGRMAVARLGAEMLAVARPERREDTRRFHDRIMQMPRIKEELAKLEQMPPGEKIEGFKHFRDVYRQVAAEEFMKLRAKFESAREGGAGGGVPGPGNFRRPPEGSPPPASPPPGPKPEPKLH